MGTYKVKVEYTFQCEWEIKAENKNDVRKLVDEDCGCVGPNYHSNLNDEDVNWEGDVHPNKSIISIKRVYRKFVK